MRKYVIPDLELKAELINELESLDEIVDKINLSRDKGLSANLLMMLRNKQKLEHVYHSNAIEGNQLTLRETEMILDGISVNERPLKDEIEARSLNDATDYLYKLIDGSEPITKRSLKELHGLIIDKKIDSQSGVFRNNEVKIKGSDHVPISYLDVDNEVDELFKWINRNSHKYKPIVMASIIHHWITWIHPFNDGNGRVSRLFLNFFLLQKGYPEINIKISDRDNYYDALIYADKGKLEDLVELIHDKVLSSAGVYEELIEEEKREKKWKKKLKDESEEEYLKLKKRFSYEYEVFKSAIDIFKQNIFKDLSLLQENSAHLTVSLKEYDELSLNKYLDMREGKSASGTWFFSVRIFNNNNYKKVILLFFFAKWVLPQEFKPREIRSNIGVKSLKAQFLGNKHFVKLFVVDRTIGISKWLDKEIKLKNIGIQDGKLGFAVPNENKPGSLKTSFENPAKISREFINDILRIYVK